MSKYLLEPRRGQEPADDWDGHTPEEIDDFPIATPLDYWDELITDSTSEMSQHSMAQVRTSTLHSLCEWTKEIAFQLALMNDRPTARQEREARHRRIARRLRPTIDSL